VLEKMPAPEIKEEHRVLGEATAKKKDNRKSVLKAKANRPLPKQSEADLLGDLLGGTDTSSIDTSATINGQQNTADLLADILGGGTSVQSPPPQVGSPAPSSASNMDSMMDMMGNGMSTAPKSVASPAPSALAGQPVYNKNGLAVTIQISRGAAGAQAQARFRNTSNFDTFTGVGLQAAVPKSQRLTLQAINKSTLEGGEEATQAMRIVPATGVSAASCHVQRNFANTTLGTASQASTALTTQLSKGRRQSCTHRTSRLERSLIVNFIVDLHSILAAFKQSSSSPTLLHCSQYFLTMHPKTPFFPTIANTSSSSYATPTRNHLVPRFPQLISIPCILTKHAKHPSQPTLPALFVSRHNHNSNLRLDIP